MQEHVTRLAEDYRAGRLGRREVFERLIALTGAYTAAHHLLEQNGTVWSVLSAAESENR